jgi:hypothetical protein
MRKGAGLFWQISHLMIFKNNKRNDEFKINVNGQYV